MHKNKTASLRTPSLRTFSIVFVKYVRTSFKMFMSFLQLYSNHITSHVENEMQINMSNFNCVDVVGVDVVGCLVFVVVRVVLS